MAGKKQPVSARIREAAHGVGPAHRELLSLSGAVVYDTQPYGEAVEQVGVFADQRRAQLNGGSDTKPRHGRNAPNAIDDFALQWLLITSSIAIITFPSRPAPSGAIVEIPR